MEEKNQFYMAGTDNTGEYVVVAVTPLGRVGFRTLDDEETRVRVEPTDEAAAESMGELLGSWKQPGEDEQFRFSKVAESDDLQETVALGLQAIQLGVDGTELNPDVPDWVKEIVVDLSR